MNYAATITKDYLACTYIDLGGSWARDTDPDKAIKRCAKITYSDWKHLYRLDGETVKVALYDVTGHDQVYMDDGRAWVEDKGGKRTYLPHIRVEQVKLPGRKKP